MINKNKLIYKIIAIIDYLKKHNGYEYKLYNICYPAEDIEPNSNIVEYAEDVLDIVKLSLEII